MKKHLFFSFILSLSLFPINASGASCFLNLYLNTRFCVRLFYSVLCVLIIKYITTETHLKKLAVQPEEL